MPAIWTRSLVAIGLIAIGTGAFAADIRPTRAGPYSRLSCDEIADRIQAANGPIGDENSSWHQFKRNPTVQFVLLGITTPDPEHDASIARLRDERNALIAAAVAKDCAAQR